MHDHHSNEHYPQIERNTLQLNFKTGKETVIKTLYFRIVFGFYAAAACGYFLICLRHIIQIINHNENYYMNPS